VGEPENPEEFVAIQIGEWGRRYGTLFVARRIWGALRPRAWDLTFYASEGGRCRILFDQPVGRLQV
jgi:hypothetical protein